MAQAKTGWFTWLLAIAFIAFGISFCVSDKKPASPPGVVDTGIGAKRDAELQEIRRQRVGRERVSGLLVDPGSAKFRSERGYCGEVNAKNSFGAYAGFARYVAPTDRLVFIEGQVPAEAFEDAWRAACD